MGECADSCDGRTSYGAEGQRRGALIFPIIKAAATTATDVGWTLRRSVLRPPYLYAAPPSELGWLSSSVNEASHLMVSVDTAGGGRWASKGREGGREAQWSLVAAALIEKRCQTSLTTTTRAKVEMGTRWEGVERDRGEGT